MEVEVEVKDGGGGRLAILRFRGAGDPGFRIGVWLVLVAVEG